MVPSEEISDKAEGVPVHLNAANLQQVIQPLGGMTVREAIANRLERREQLLLRRNQANPRDVQVLNFHWK
jgi:hypothetical protein